MGEGVPQQVQMSVPWPGWEYHHPHPGYPLSRDGYSPSPGMGYPSLQRWGTLPPPLFRDRVSPGIGQQIEYLIRGGRYTSCVHTLRETSKGEGNVFTGLSFCSGGGDSLQVTLSRGMVSPCGPAPRLGLFCRGEGVGWGVWSAHFGHSSPPPPGLVPYDKYGVWRCVGITCNVNGRSC